MKKIPISFRENEIEMKIYDYIKKQLNYSVYVKQLVLKDMEEKEVNVISTIDKKSKINVDSNNIEF